MQNTDPRFDQPVDRSHTDSMKWTVADGELPMWVADMDLQTCPAVSRAIQQRAAHGIYGYTLIPDEWYDAYIHWWKTRHNFTMEKEWLMFCTGVVPAISSMVRRLSHPAENVVLLTPVYNIFYNSILNAGRNVLECELQEQNGVYSIDWDAFEACLAQPQTTLLIFCNPHNPVGKIWSAEEIERIAHLCSKYGVRVISDEIHCDLTLPGTSYTPFASVSDTAARISATCLSPSKAFNIAGLHTAAIMVPDSFLRHQVYRGINNEEIAEPEVFACIAAIAAYTKGAEWLDGLNAYLAENRRITEAFCKDNIPSLSVIHSQATYLIWLDCRKITDNADALQQFLRTHAGLYLSEGSEYGKGGEAFLRLNAACSRKTLMEGLKRLKKGIDLYLQQQDESSI